MLACIACTKDGAKDGARAETTPSTKSLTSQIKDIVLKLSGLQCKGGGAAAAAFRHKSDNHRHRGSHTDIEDGVGSHGGSHCGYNGAASSSSTPAWDFPAIRRDEENNGEPKEWTALVEPGVQITFVSLAGGGGNDLKRIRFSREMFNKLQAQRWWGENFDRIMELYNVQRFSRQALPTPPRSDDGDLQRESFYSRVGSTRESPVTPPPFGRNHRSNSYSYHAPGSSGGGCGVNYLPSVPDPTEHIIFRHHHAAAFVGMTSLGGKAESCMMDGSRRTTAASSRDDEASVSASNASDIEMTEWVEEDEPGVYITIRELSDGTRELRRVRFSRERFGEVHAKLWWEDNRERIQAQYL